MVVCVCVCECVSLRVFSALVGIVLAITALLGAPSLFLCDCPQQEVASPVCPPPLLTQEVDHRGISASLAVCLAIYSFLYFILV